jgi:hypothetical protein
MMETVIACFRYDMGSLRRQLRKLAGSDRFGQFRINPPYWKNVCSLAIVRDAFYHGAGMRTPGPFLVIGDPLCN